MLFVVIYVLTVFGALGVRCVYRRLLFVWHSKRNRMQKYNIQNWY
jgi:hypothetical protein